MSLKGKTAIAGLGLTRMGKNYDHSNALGFPVESIQLALDDAGLKRSDLDGVLSTFGVLGGELMVNLFSNSAGTSAFAEKSA